MSIDTATACAAQTLAYVPPDAGRLQQARWATRAQFLGLGLAAGAWGAHIPSVKARYGLGEGQLSVVLLAAGIGAILSLLLAGRLVGRIGARNAAALAAATMGSMLALVLLWPGYPVLLVAMVVFGAGSSLYDVAINVEGTTLETIGGRGIMSGLHGMFSVGGMSGAGLVAFMLHAGVPALTQLVVLGAAVALLSFATSRLMLDVHPPAEAGEAHFVWPRGLLLIIGLLALAGMTAEGVMYDWSVLYLEQEVGMPQAQAALGYASFSAAMALTRFGGDALRDRFDERVLLRAGGVVAALAMLAVLLSGHPAVSLAGYALVGAGLAIAVPVLFNAATRVPGVSRAAAIAAVSSIGYAGFMLGPPLIGGIAHHSSLTAAMGVMVVAAGLLAFGAGKVPPADPRA